MAKPSVDTKQLLAHVVQVRTAGPAAMTGIEAATKLAAKRIQGVARNGFAGTRHWTRVPQDITYDVDRNGFTVTADIGRKRGIGGQSALMHLLEYGSSRFGPIKPTLGPALDYNADPYAAMVAAAAVLPIGKGVGKMGRISKP